MFPAHNPFSPARAVKGKGRRIRWCFGGLPTRSQLHSQSVSQSVEKWGGRTAVGHAVVGTYLVVFLLSWRIPKLVSSTTIATPHRPTTSSSGFLYTGMSMCISEHPQPLRRVNVWLHATSCFFPWSCLFTQGLGVAVGKTGAPQLLLE